MTQHLITYGPLVQDLPIGGQFAVDQTTTTGLTFGFRSGLKVTGDTRVVIATGTVALTDDATNWVHITASTVTVNSGATPTEGHLLYKVITASGVITTITDLRGCIVTVETSF